MIIKVIRSDNSSDISVETYRSGIFKFQIGFDRTVTAPLFNRVIDAHNLFNEVPILPHIAKQLEDNVLVSSVFGTNTIEGGTITQEEIKDLFSSNPSIEDIAEEKRRRVINIKNAYKIADEQAEAHGAIVGKTGVHFDVTEELILELHDTVTGGIAHPTNVAGQYRNNPKGLHTRVSDLEHGGVYTPPKCLEDIKTLMKVYIEWINSDELKSLHSIERAHLSHYYFERIHPFYDGNGRVGRVIEAIILKCSGMNYAPFALASSYLEHIDEYFLVFNKARKSEEKNEEYPNTVFLAFCLERLRDVFNSLHKSVNNLIRYLLYTNSVNAALVEKEINTRQFTIINNLLTGGIKHDLSSVRSEYWYSGMYLKLTPKTRERDLKGLVELGFIRIEKGTLFIELP